jgi:prefoldin subunit 5
VLQRTLKHNAEEAEALKGQLSTMNEARQVAIQQLNDIKKEKEDLEEMFAATGKLFLYGIIECHLSKPSSQLVFSHLPL